MKGPSKMKSFRHHNIGRRFKLKRVLSVVFSILGIFGILVLTSTKSSTLAAGQSQSINWNNAKYLTGGFWSQGPSDTDIKNALYGSNSVYRSLWPSNICNQSNISVQRNITQFPAELSENTIYVFTTGAVQIVDTINVPKCVAIVSSIDGGTTVYSSAKKDQMFSILGSTYGGLGQPARGIIIDNINFDGKYNKAGSSHTNNGYCLSLYADREILNYLSSVSINNSTISRCGKGIMLDGGTRGNAVSSISLSNIRLINNTGGGISVVNGGHIFMNNIVGISDSDSISLNADYSTINNAVATQIYFAGGTGLVANRIVGNVSSLINGCILNDVIGYVGGCKAYGYHIIPKRPNYAAGQSTQGQILLYYSLGWSAYSLQNNVGCYTRDYAVNALNTYNNKWVLDWNSAMLNGNEYGQPVGCWFNASFYQSDNNSVRAKNYKFSYGSGVPMQRQPVYRSGTTLKLWNTDYNSNYFIGSNLVKVNASTTLPSIVTGSTTSFTVNSTNTSLISKYNVLGPFITTPKYNINRGTNTSVTWSAGDGDKLVILQVTGANYHAMHFVANTEKVSSGGPTFTLNGTSTPECNSKTWTAFSDYSSTYPHSTPYAYKLPGSSSWSNWSNNTQISYTAGHDAGSFTLNGKARDTLGNETTHTGTITVADAQPTANNFIGSNNVGCSSASINWKTASSATEGNCGNTYLSAAVQSQGSKGTCSINHTTHMLTYTPNGTAVGNDTCIIRISDDENNYVDKTVTRKNIDCSNPDIYGTITINTGAAATSGTSLTLGLTWNGATKVRFSCDGTSWPSTRNDLLATMSYTLGSSYGCNTNQGTKTIYAQFSGGGNTYTASDDIIYDKDAPIVSISSSNGLFHATVTVSDLYAGLSGGQYLWYKWQTSSACSNNQSDYTQLTTYYSDGDLNTSVNISSVGLAGTYYLCIYRGLYDRAGNVTGTTFGGPYTYNSTGAGCSWVTQPVSPIGPNNVNETGTAIMSCYYPVRSLANKLETVLRWIGYSSDYPSQLSYYNAFLTNVTGTYIHDTSSMSLIGTYHYKFRNVVSGSSYTYPNNYPITLVRSGLNVSMPIADVPSDPIQFDFVAPTSTITSPSTSTIGLGDITFDITDTDNRGNSALSGCYYSLNGGSPVERDCNGSFVVDTAHECFKACRLCVWANDNLGNIGDDNNCIGYELSYSLPTVNQAEIYSGNRYSDGINNYYKGRVSARALYDGIGVTNCQYTLDNGSTWQDGSRDDDYCYANNITPNANITINFRAHNPAGYSAGTSSTWIYDNVSPYVDNKTDFGTGWYNTPQTSEFTFVDTGAGVSGTNVASCTISTEGTNKTCSVSSNIKDYLGNTVGSVTSNPVNLDMTAPIISSLSKNPTTCINNVSITINATDNLTSLSNLSYGYIIGGQYFSNGSNSGFSVTENGTVTGVAIDLAGNTGYKSISITNIDSSAPTAVVTDAFGYECSTITGSISASDAGCGNGNITYMRGDGDFGSSASYGLSGEEVDDYYVPVLVKDGAGNITPTSVRYTWNDLAITGNTTYNLGTLTGNKTISNIITAFNIHGQGSCETITVTPLAGCVNASQTLNGNSLTISPLSSISGNGSCSVTFSDGDTTITGTINFVVDSEIPVGSVSTTSTLKATSQTATIGCTDGVGVTKYYWGTGTNPADSAYTTITSNTTYSTTKTVSAAGTYNLYCKDAAGNISTVASKTYYSYEVHNMLNAVDKAEGTYNTTNYPQTGSTSTYIAPSGTSITMTGTNAVYSMPTESAAAQYKGWTTSNSGTPSSTASDTLNGNKIYYFWFNRKPVTLTLSKGTGISAVSNGGTNTTNAVTYKYGQTVNIDATVSVGYTWSKWTKSAGNDPASATTKGTTVTLTANTTLTATTTANTYKVTYNKGTATAGSITVDGTTTQYANLPKEQSRTYPNASTLGTNNLTKSNTDIVTYTVTLSGHGGTPTTASKTTTRYTGYTANGWTTTQGSQTRNYANGASFGANDTTNLVLYPCFTQAATTPAITLPGATRAGYTFMGWSTASNDTGVEYASGASYTPTQNTTLYAVWKKTITISFDVNSNGGSNSDKTCDMWNNDASCSITSPSITCNSNTPNTIGWSTAAGTHSNSWTGGTAKSVSADATYYAQCKSNQWTYGMSFNANNNTIDATSKSCTTTLTYNGTAPTQSCSATCPKITAPSGFSVIGFSNAAGTHNAGVCNSEGTITLSASNNGSAGYAQSSKSAITYTAIFNPNGASSIGYISTGCTIDGVFNGANQPTSCNVLAPSITAPINFVIRGWNANQTAISGTVATGGIISLSSNATYYAIVKAIPQISFANPTPAHNAAVTQNRFTAKMDISNIDEIQSFEYKYDNTPYDVMNGLVLMYNFDKVSSLGESNTLVKDLSHNGKDGSVNGATWTSNGKYGGAYSFDGNDYIKFTGLSLTNYTIVLWEKTSAGSWRHIVITNGTKYVNGISSSVGNSRVDLSNGYIGRVGSSYYNGIIDEVRIYNRTLSQDEIQFLYKSNLKKTSENTWEFETLNTCLNATGTYNYTGKVVSYVDTQAATGRKLTTNIPLVSVSGTGYDFGTHTASGSVQTLNGTMGTLTVTDKLGNSGWLVYLATSDTLVGKNTAQTIDTTNLKFKANSLVFNGLYDSSVNTHVAFGNGISTSQYKTAHSNCAAGAEHCASSSAKILEYMRRSAEPYDFMCGDVGTYSDDTKIQLEVPAWQIQDTYEGTLWITLQDDYGFRQRGTGATIN